MPGIEHGTVPTHPPLHQQMASSSQPHQQHLPTQSYYDELLSDNAELYDLADVAHSPSQQDQCVVETLEELSSGLGSAPSSDTAANGDDAPGRRTLDHLILHHPSSARGAAMRARRTNLEAALAALDRLIQTDGTVQPLPADGKVEGVLGHLRLVSKECSGIALHGDEGEGSEGSEGGATSTDGRHAYRSLVLFQTTSSIYTLMSLLGVVALPSSVSESGGDCNGNEVSEPTEREERVLRQVCRTLTVLLSPPTGALVRAIQSDNNAIAVDDANGSGEGGADANASSEADQAIAAALSPPSQPLKLIKSTKSDIRDSFVAFERLVGLIGRYTSLVATASGNGEGAWGVLTDLARLAAAACGGCERNKVAFVRAGKKKKEQQNAAGGGGSGGNGRDGSGGIAAVVAVLTMLTQQSEGTNGEAKVVVQPAMAAYCKLLAVLCRFDDFRSPSATTNGAGGGGALPTPDMTVSSAHDHVLEFHRQGIVPILHEVTSLALKENECGDGEDGQDGNVGVGRDTDLASAALAATRTLAVNDEIVQALVAVGVLRSARLALAAGVADADGGNSTEDKTKAKQLRALTSASLGLIRNLCGNDEIKTNLCLGTADGNVETSTVLPSIIRAMRLYRTDAAVQEHGCATLAAMALRKPANAQRIVEEGGPMEVLTAMRRHPSVVPVQRQGALAVRNISSRLIKIAEAEQIDGSSTGNVGNDAVSPKSSAADTTTPVEVRETFLDLGAESVLRDIAGKHQGSVDEAYAALRDLGCKVSMVRYDTNDDGQAKSGSGTRGVTMFGEAKTKFNPVFEESNELGAAVDRL